MAGYGASLDFDEKAMQDLPTGKDAESTSRRRALFRQADMNGNGIVSLAECDRLIVTVLAIKGVKIMKPVINRAFHAARDIVPSVGEISAHYVDFHEFRFFLIYLKHYLELFLIFCNVEHRKDKGKYSDRRMSYAEFEAAIPQLLKWGVDTEVEKLLRRDPAAVFRDIDANGGGVVLFDEFAHWALWNHLFHLDGSDDGELEEALEVLKKQKPNLCGKDLASVKAAKAKYRVDAKISGQGCLGGDPSLAGGYEELPDGGAELAAGGHYPGGLAAWKAGFHGMGKRQDEPGTYRCVARIAAINEGVSNRSKKIGEIRNGEEFEILEVVDCHDEQQRIRARVESPTTGWISLLNTSNAFRWAIKLKSKPASPPVLGDAWRSSLERVEEANDFFEKHGIPECVNGCGQPRFGRYPTCCTHCRGSDGPHARSCKGRGYKNCVNGCGHPQFGKYDTCCTHCKGAEGPHAAGCTPQGKCGVQSAGRDSKPRAVGRECSNGCRRLAFKQYPTCCTWCKGCEGPHHADCNKREEDEAVRRELRNLFYKTKDLPHGLSHGKFQKLLADISWRGDAEQITNICDRNHDGVIDIDEFLDWLWSGEVSASDRHRIVGRSH
eukprot:TRINITY_DN47900_c0_g1_i1.p1 TRINITY_DN47900_c0_g1~~TRINITY_DN47900_c0_g1_i1.p1  ORF type:complete len:608 (+),score=84.24 TRINITY_DN47900_c0_g1_i1:77-1900(+)